MINAEQSPNNTRTNNLSQLIQQPHHRIALVKSSNMADAKENGNQQPNQMPSTTGDFPTIEHAKPTSMQSPKDGFAVDDNYVD